MPRPSALVPFLALLLASCFSSPGGESRRRPPTLIAVSPDDFLGDVPCADASGALRRYVVRLFDHGTAEEPLSFELPAAVIGPPPYQPVPCTQTAVFGHVVPTHKYSAIVEAYDRVDLHALGPGSSVLVDGAGNHVPPRWATRCGRDEAGNATQGAVVSAQYAIRFVRGCEPLTSTEPAADSAITLSVSEIAGAPGCGSGPDQIERFEARYSGNLASTQTAACGQSVVFAPLLGGAPYAFELLAFEAGATTPSLGTTCFRVALAGATVSAQCDPLRGVGALEIDVDALLGPASCGTGAEIASVTAWLGDDSATGCGILRFNKLAPGAYAFNLSSARWDDTPGPGAVCSGTVEPGLVTRATCTLLPIGP
jgi:hypothetical protein